MGVVGPRQREFRHVRGLPREHFQSKFRAYQNFFFSGGFTDGNHVDKLFGASGYYEDHNPRRNTVVKVFGDSQTGREREGTWFSLFVQRKAYSSICLSVMKPR